MKLHEHLVEKKVSMAAWGRACGVAGRATARRYVKGELIPPRAVMSRTYVWSAGQVTPNDFYDLPELPDSGEASAPCECRRVA